MLATGRCHTVREFAELAFAEIGVQLAWEGEGVDEIGRNRANGRILVRIDPRYFRPTDVDVLMGDYSKAERELGWRPTTDLFARVQEMVAEDLKEIAAQNGIDPAAGFVPKIAAAS